jgi:hypothetical protein
MRSRFGILFLLFLVIGFVLPWWFITAVGFGAGIKRTGAKLNSFTEAFLACAASWLLLAFYFDARSGFHLSPKIGGLMNLPWPVLPIFVVALLGGLISGLSALAGSSLVATLRAGNYGA